MVTVILPVMNEERTIANIVRQVKSSPLVSEVLVIDDKSIDRTVEEANSAGAKVITSTKIGKGASMLDGLGFSKNELIVYLDGDIDPYPDNIIEKLVEPLINNEADFIKGSFSRQAGRVTELVAKPLLSLLFPDLLKFSQPLSGIIAGKKNFFEKIIFENDYGVDIGILIDMSVQNVRIKEVFIGNISNKMKPWQELGKMSHEVARTIISRGLKHSSTLVNLDELQTINIIRDQMEFAIKDSIKGLRKMAVFDMDNTILNGRFIESSSRILNFEKGYLDVLANNDEPYLITKGIAKLLKGYSFSQLLSIADSIPLNRDIVETVKELKNRGYIVGIITDSYDFVANHIKNKISADFFLANELEFSNSVATGEVKIPSFFIKNDESKCNHNYCKSNALINIAKQHKIDLSNIVSVGDSKNDICMVRLSGIGVSYRSKDNVLNFSADKLIKGSFSELLEYAL